MPTTSKGLPYPPLNGHGVTPDVPRDINALAVATDAYFDQRGKSIIATTESRTNVAYGTLTTPDQVSGIVLPTDGLIMVFFQAMWQESVANAARAAIFVGANQLQAQLPSNLAPVTVAAARDSGSSPNFDTPLHSTPAGLVSYTTSGGASADVTTGQIVGALNGTAPKEDSGAGLIPGATGPIGGPCYIFAAAGTYDISVKFKSSSGSVTAKNRKLWVRALSFG